MSQRKLQQEIDRTFKKVNEGIDEFDYIYEKLLDSDNQSQKEKLEGDLKKEIKKLQRCREQIKNWMGGSEVKDTKPLAEYRKKIEREMERFKEVEKIMKTKAFSNEALASGTLSLDPRQKEKVKCSEFLEANIDELQRQAEAIEADVDRMYATLKKRRADASKQQELEEQEERLKKHRYHIKMLESVMRQLMNDKLQVEQVNEIRDDIEYYVDSNDDPNFIEDDDFYEELGLDETTGEFIGGDEDEDDENEDGEDADEEDEVNESGDVESRVSQETTPPAVPGVAKEPQNKHRDGEKARTSRLSSVSRVSSHSTHSVSAASASRSNSISDVQSAPQSQSLASQLLHTPKPKSAIPVAPTTSILTGGLKPATPVGTPKLKYATVASAALHQVMNRSQSSSSIKDQKQLQPLQSLQMQAQLSQQTSQSADDEESRESTPAGIQGTNGSSSGAYVSTGSSFMGSSLVSADVASSIQKSLSFLDLSNYTNLPDGFDKYVEALETAKERLVEFRDPADEDRKNGHPLYDMKLPPFESIFPQLESSLLNCPDSYDADTPKNYVPANQFVTQPCFPQEPAVEITGSAKLLKKLEIDTLAYCFYYHNQKYESSFTNVHHSVDSLDDDYLQYITAKELHSRDWKYEKELKTWFHKEEEEGVDAEAGEETEEMDGSTANWQYFDYKDTWMVRRKAGFKFNENDEETSFF
ncbi:DEKNAAC105149 [Brettanomyces naardenensis]|uniref:General negative regulator of transcription subunit n=1 Tax=Brettanomyces naardenensis TaxID=13370 RepID=A0A448YSQ4_BRENA|nr:DEKNAAC105149 [Brettanomyces naardenensis]